MHKLMTETDLEQIKNHISNISSVAVMYVPELIEAVEQLLAERVELKGTVANLSYSLDARTECAAWQEGDLRKDLDAARTDLTAAAEAHERDIIKISRALGNYHEPPGSVDELVEAISKLRHEKRQLRSRLVECRPWVGVCPTLPQGIHDVCLIRDITDDSLEEVKE